MLFNRIKRFAALSLTACTLTGGALTAAVVTAAPAHAVIGSWLDPMTHSRASCAGGSIVVQMPGNELAGAVRTETLLRWNGYQFASTNINVSATSNGSYYFWYGWDGVFTGWHYVDTVQLLVPYYSSYYRVMETVRVNGRITSQAVFGGYETSPYAADSSWCFI